MTANAASPLPLDADDQALPCRTIDPDLWTSPIGAQQRQAADFCLDCPWMFDCRAWARATGQAGVCGGETDAERRLALQRSATGHEG